MKVRLSLGNVYGQDHVLLLSVVLPSSSLRFIAKFIFTEEHCIGKHFLWSRLQSVRGGGSAQECRKGRAAGCILFMIKAMLLTQKTFFTLIQRRGKEESVLHRVSDVFACNMVQERSFFFSG